MAKKKCKFDIDREMAALEYKQKLLAIDKAQLVEQQTNDGAKIGRSIGFQTAKWEGSRRKYRKDTQNPLG